MIRLGGYGVNLYPNNGIYINNRGVITFNGSCVIGNNSFISVAKTGRLEFGDGFGCTASLKLACYNSITFGNHVLVGWDCLIIDTDFHALSRKDGTKSKGHAPIVVGDDVWIANSCKILKRSYIPSKCVVSAQTIISSKLEIPEYSVIGHKYEIVVKAKDRFRNHNDDTIDFT